MSHEALVQTALRYIHAGYELISLHPHQKNPIGHWRHADPLLSESIPNIVAGGCNIGVRLRACDLLIDVDIKNGSPGKLGLARLKKDFPELETLPYATRTASKGYHYLFTLPEFVNGADIPYLVARYPGIQFMSIKRQALIGGCEVESGSYEIHPDMQVPAVEAPLGLVDALLAARNKPAGPPLESTQAAVEKGWGVVTPEELAHLLEYLAPEDFAADTPLMWFDLMCACHFATAGTGQQEFIDWSEEDPTYSGHAPLMVPRWRSLDEGTGKNPITTAYLVKVLQDAGADVPWFYDKVQLAKAEVFMDQGAKATDTVDVVSILRRMIRGGIDALTMQKWKKEMVQRDSQLTMKSLHDAEKEILREEKVARKTEADKRRLSKLGEEMEIAEAMVEDAGGPGMLIWQGDRFYRWNGKGAFEEYPDKKLGRVIASLMREHDTEATSRWVHAVRDLMKNICYVDPWFWDTDGSNEGQMFNMDNGELWLTSTGELDLRPHNPASRRRITLPISYDPDNLGLPEVWLRYLASAFPGTDLQAVSDKLAIGIAYTLTESRPFLKKCFYLDGPTNTGKSVVLNLLSHMCGEDHTSELGLQEINGRFGPQGLIGKLANTEAEVSNVEKLDSSRFKAIVAGDTIPGERKGVDSFKMRPTTVLWMGGNVLPKFIDGASGILERFCFIPYRNALPEHERDKDLTLRLKAEMEDIFHWALQVYAREYLRDRCESALAVELSIQPAEELMMESVPYQGWLDNCLEFTNDRNDFAFSIELYDSYVLWHADNPGAPGPRSRMSFGGRVGRWLREMPGRETEHGRRWRDGKQEWGWAGVKIVPDDLT